MVTAIPVKVFSENVFMQVTYCLLFTAFSFRMNYWSRWIRTLLWVPDYRRW